MKRFLLFGGYTYYPRGGWIDLKGWFDTVDEAIEAATTATDNMTAEVGYDWWHVIDSIGFGIAAAGEGASSIKVETA